MPTSARWQSSPLQLRRRLRSGVELASRRLLRPRRLIVFICVCALIYLAHWHWTTSSEQTLSPDLYTPPHSPPVERISDAWPSKDVLYRPVIPLNPPAAPFPRLEGTRTLPPSCMESWFARGELDCTNLDLGPEDKLDVTWLWVNGSDARWEEEMVYWRGRHGVYSPDFHFREVNELVYSMRSVLASMSGVVRNFHLVLYDFAFDQERDEGLLPEAVGEMLKSPSELGKMRVAQTPRWLNFSNLQSPGGPQLRYATHSELFRLPSGDRSGRVEDPDAHARREAEWRTSALPTYSSKSIETRLGWLPDLSDAFVAMNDDFFLLRPHAVADFHSLLYGSVIRFDPGYYQQVRPVLNRKHFNDAGETSGLYHANYWLSKRFPSRFRPYIVHGPKSLSRSLHHEASLMFAEALTRSSARRFRELPDADGDIQIQWLLVALRVERWREALLWTFVVANLGEAGVWDKHARGRIAKLLGVKHGQPGVKAAVQRGARTTLKHSRVEKTLKKAGWQPPKVASYRFSSMDGHMPPIVYPGQDESVNDRCVIDMDACFGAFWRDGQPTPSEEMFKHLTFKKPECGDCLIMALVTASGPRGLSAFFPPTKRTYTNPGGQASPGQLPVPHLPLTSTWEEGDFSLAAVLASTAAPGKVNLRKYCMTLLSRYFYVSGDVPAQFHMLKDAEQVREALVAVDGDTSAAALGLNDNIDREFEEIKEGLEVWFEGRWPLPAPWERM